MRAIPLALQNTSATTAPLLCTIWFLHMNNVFFKKIICTIILTLILAVLDGINEDDFVFDKK